MKTRYLLWLLPLLLFCCKKKDTSHAGPVPPVTFAYSVQYDSVISMYPNDSFNFSFSINVITGNIDSNNLTCAVIGLPSGETVAPASMVVGQLRGGIFVLKSGNIATGNYTLQLVINGTELHSFIVKIIPRPDYAPILAGTYTGAFDFCNPSSFFYYTSVVTTVVDTPYELKISNVKNLGAGFIVTAWVSDIITIPVQVIDSQTIWGKGTYSKDYRAGYAGDYVMIINDTIAKGTDTQACIIHIQH